jgi:hypothetical protein
VSLRFTGKCSGCELKPLTLAASVRPALLTVAGVTAVTAAGARVSEEALQRMEAAWGGDETRRRWLDKVHAKRQENLSA